MRCKLTRCILTGAALLLLLSAAEGQHRSDACVPGACPPHHCPPRYCPPAAQPEAAPEEEGAYVQGPAVGEYAGESSAIGIRGFSLRFPEVNIELPTLRLPSLVHFRRNPELLVESSRAPFVEREAAEYREAVPETFPEPEPEGAPERDQPPVPYPCYPQPYPCVPGCVSHDSQEQRVLQLSQQVADLKQLVEQLADLQMQQGGIPPEAIQQSQFEQAGRDSIGRATLDDAVQSPAAPRQAPSNAQTGGEQAAAQQARVEWEAEQRRLAAEYEQKCHEVDDLRSQIAEMQRQYQLVLEMQQNELLRQREERLRRELTEQASHDEPSASSRQSSHRHAEFDTPAGTPRRPRPMPHAFSPPAPRN